MEFQKWKEMFSHKHISGEMQVRLNELTHLRKSGAASTDLTLRMQELNEFERSVEKLLIAEWKHFIDAVEKPFYC